jgi:hypothetical protein
VGLYQQSTLTKEEHMATATILHDIPIGQTEHLYTGTLAFDSSYPTGGEAINASANERFEMVIAQPTGGYSFSWDAANQKMKVFQTGSHTHDLFIKGGQAAASTSATAYYATDIFGKEAVTDKTILGVDSATKGGVVSAVARAQAEVADTTSLAALTDVPFIAVGS